MTLNLDGTGKSDIHTGIGFFDHMLDGFARHGLFDLSVSVDGDLDIDGHHTIEDTGIVLGTAIREAVGDKQGIRRYGDRIRFYRLCRRLHGPACGQLYAGRYSRSVGYDAAVATLRAGRSIGSVARQSARGNARPGSVAAGRRLFGRALRHVGGAGRSRPDCRRAISTCRSSARGSSGERSPIWARPRRPIWSG